MPFYYIEDCNSRNGCVLPIGFIYRDPFTLLCRIASPECHEGHRNVETSGKQDIIDAGQEIGATMELRRT